MQVRGTKLLVQLVSELFIHWSNIWSIRGSYDACVALPLPAIVDLPPVASSGQFGANISWRRFSMLFRHGIKFWGNGSEGTNQVTYLWFCSGHSWATKWIQRLMINLSDTVLSEWWSPARIILWTVSVTTSCSVSYFWAGPSATLWVHPDLFQQTDVWVHECTSGMGGRSKYELSDCSIDGWNN